MVTVIFKENKKALKIKGCVSDALVKAGINPVTVVIKKNGKFATIKDAIKDSDVIEAISAVSGG